jgi:hypothetical protein
VARHIKEFDTEQLFINCSREALRVYPCGMKSSHKPETTLESSRALQSLNRPPRSGWTRFLGGLMRVAAAALCAGGLLTVTGCCRWQKDVVVQGVTFQKATIDKRGFVIGWVDQDVTIHGRPCKQGWVHLHPNGALAGFTAAKEIALNRLTIPAGTWVFQDTNGTVTVCAFPHDTEVQGHLCRGGGVLGGSEGVQTAFYADGALKQFFAPHPVQIENVPCDASLFHKGIQLYEDGRLRSATLSEDFVRDGRVYHQGERLESK